MPRVVIPITAPKEGTLVPVLEGPADGRQVPFSGMRLNYAELKGPEYHGDAAGEVDGDQLRRVHVYAAVEEEHPLTGEMRWLYRYSHTEF